MPKSYFIKTYGCQMNVADSSKLAEVLESAGYQKSPEVESADIILVNTCVVRQLAEDRAAGYINSIKNFKRQKPNLKIGVCGCITKAEHLNLKKRFPFVDWFIPPNSPDRLREFLVHSSKFLVHEGRPAARETFVTIMHGCDNFCSYCIVPYVRGRETSRPPDEVLAEIAQLVGQGAKSIILLGQNVNSYKYGLADLLKKIGSLIPRSSDNLSAGSPDIRISFLTSHPKDLSDELIQAVHDLPYVEKEFMMPLQSGDNEILKRMNRGYTLEHYLDRVEKMRSLMPQARIFSDLLVGFPGETEEQFQNTLKAVKKIGFKMAHMFAYSPRLGTAASQMPDQVPEEIKQDRLKRLIDVVREVVRS